MGIFRKGSKANSIFYFKCPRCQEADLFYTPTFSFKRSFDMKERCEHCDLNYLPEPGYYYGAMFISYIFTGWFSIVFVMLLHWVLDLSLNLSFLILIAVLALLFVYIYRLARSIWISMNVKYQPEKRKKPVA